MVSPLEARSVRPSDIIIAAVIISVGCAMYSVYSFEEHRDELPGMERSHW